MLSLGFSRKSVRLEPWSFLIILQALVDCSCKLNESTNVAKISSGQSSRIECGLGSLHGVWAIDWIIEAR